jgi:hypothetical protein
MQALVAIQRSQGRLSCQDGGDNTSHLDIKRIRSAGQICIYRNVVRCPVVFTGQFIGRQDKLVSLRTDDPADTCCKPIKTTRPWDWVYREMKWRLLWLHVPLKCNCTSQRSFGNTTVMLFPISLCCFTGCSVICREAGTIDDSVSLPSRTDN